MPIQPIAFQPLSFQQNNPLLMGFQGAQDAQKQQLLNALLKTQVQYAPQDAQQDLLSKQLQNQLDTVKAQYAPQMTQAELAVKQAMPGLYGAQSQEMLSRVPLNQSEVAKNQMYLNNPLLNMPGTAGQLGAYLYLKQKNPEMLSSPSQGIDGVQQPGNISQQQGQSLPDLLMNSLTSGLRKNAAQADLYEKRAGGFDYLNLPPDQKASLIAQASGMGYSPTEAVQHFIQGQSIDDLASAKGFDKGNYPDPIYPVTKASLNQIQRRQQALTEINAMMPQINAAIAPYSQRFAGYSPKQIAQSLTNEDPDAQARFLAARALMPEMSSLRIKAMGGQVGIEAMREVANASMGNIKAFQGLVTPDIYTKANQYVDQWITQGANSANKVGLTSRGSPQVGNYTQADLEYTAKKHGMTVDQVKQQLGIQ